METRNHGILFTGLVVNIEQMEVRIGGKGWHVYQVVRHPGGVGVLPLHDDGTVTLLADEVASSVDEHARFGGVVPEIASRAHAELVSGVVAEALVEAGASLDDVDAPEDGV